ncbi:MAG: S8 family peptidase [Candidatus Saccharicenans sp.]|jgi:subtilisin family serine protease|nr:S8 family peptidase [Candidatus Saccharicenans sp.]MDH7493965.1 S8 family peptidase [Candidatus Saccharicenans sp.]
MSLNNHRKISRLWPVAISVLLALVLVITVTQTGAQNKLKDRLAASSQKTSGRLEEALKARLNPAPPTRIKALAQPVGRPSGPKYSSEKILVKFKPDLSTQSTEQILRAYQPQSYRLIPRINVYVVKVGAGTTVEETLAALRQNPDVLYAGPDYKLRLAAQPNDQLFRYQYALYNPGGTLQIPGSPTGKVRADIKVTGAWDFSRGDPNLLIAVLDSGIDYTHPDLASKVISTGRDFINDDDDAMDDHWHGTHVAGIIAAATNNTEGIAGVAWDCRLLPGKIISAEGEGDYSDLIDALIWAADYSSGQAKVGVINMSVGGDEPDQALRAALEYAYNKGIVLVAATGNDGVAGVLYPAAYDEFCLAVSASDYSDEIASFSNSGPQVDVAAPGVWVLSTIPLAITEPGYLPYAFASGTSMATPHVAGFAALLKANKPWLTPADIMKIIKYTPDDIETAGRDDYAGYGRINTERALSPFKIVK